MIIPLVSYLFFRNINKENVDKTKEKIELPKWYTFIPLFVIGFLLFTFLRTIGDITLNAGVAFGLFQQDTWKSIYNNVSSFGTTYLLGMAMAGVGLSTNFNMFKGIGIKPFYIGFIATISVGIVSITLISLFGHLIVV